MKNFNISVFKSHDIEVSPGKVVHIGNRKSQVDLEKKYGIADSFHIKERVKQARESMKKSYTLSEETKKLHYHIKNNGINHTLLEKKMPQYLRDNATRNRDKIQIQAVR